jgi:LPXTG-site transpeptidase (sortase) family protein
MKKSPSYILVLLISFLVGLSAISSPIVFSAQNENSPNNLQNSNNNNSDNPDTNKGNKIYNNNSNENKTNIESSNNNNDDKQNKDKSKNVENGNKENSNYNNEDKHDKENKENKGNKEENKDHKIGICHATGSSTNPYVFIQVDEHAISAHSYHQDGRDIVGVDSEANCPHISKGVSPTPEITPTEKITPSTTISPTISVTPTTTTTAIPTTSVTPTVSLTPTTSVTPTLTPIAGLTLGVGGGPGSTSESSTNNTTSKESNTINQGIVNSITNNTEGTVNNQNSVIQGLKNSTGQVLGSSILPRTAEPNYVAEALPTDSVLIPGSSINIPAIGLNKDLFKAEKVGNEYLTGHDEVFALNSQTLYAHNTQNGFGTLTNLQVGDTIFVNDGKSAKIYKVSSMEKVYQTDLSVLENNDENLLTLITCDANDFSYRLVIKAERTD